MEEVITWLPKKSKSIISISDFISGWNPFVTSWIETRDGQVEKANLTILFDKYIPTLQDAVKYRFKKITPIPEISHIQTLCRLLECLIVPQNIPSNDPPKVLILKSDNLLF